MHQFSCVKRMLSKNQVNFDRVLIALQLSLEVLLSFLKTGLISVIFIKFGNLFSFRQSLKILASFSQQQVAKFFIIENGMSFDIDALFVDNFLTASIILSLDVTKKKNFHHQNFPLLTYSFLCFQKIEIYLLAEAWDPW